MRVGVWLWATQQLKSRPLATATARAGHVRIDGTTAKATSQVKVDDEVRPRVNGFGRMLGVLELLPKRVGVPEAMGARRDITPPRLAGPAAGAVIFRPHSTEHLTEKERHQLDALRDRTTY